MIDNYIFDKDCYFIKDFVAIQRWLINKKSVGILKKEVLEYGPKVISFLILNQKVTENKKIMDSKSQKDLTKIEIDAYNKLINELNKEVDVYNKLNTKFN